MGRFPVLTPPLPPPAWKSNNSIITASYFRTRWFKWIFGFAVLLCICVCLHAFFSAAHTSIAVGRVSLYPEWIYTTIVSVCLSKTVCTVWMCVCVYIWLYVGRWQGFVFTTSVLAVCACGFLHFTAASSTQPHRSCVFSLFHSVIVSIIKAVFAGRILSRQRITGSLNCWNGPARGSCV